MLDSMEEDAEEYLYELIERNLVIVNDIDSFGKPKSVRIHDLFRDICIREAEKEKFFCILNRDIPLDLMEIYTQRRLVFDPTIEEDDGSACSSIFPRNDSCLAIRSFFCHGEQNFSSTIDLPLEILELVNLKYLQLGQVSEIPSSISRLRNLQTLISLCQDDQSILPTEIWEMPQLRHLFVCGFRMPDIPDVQGKGANACVLKNLQTLEGIFDFRCTQDVPTRIPNLKRLLIFNTMPFHSLSNLVYLCKLESLQCWFDDAPADKILPNYFSSSLKKLVLSGCQIPWEQLTIIGILPNLEVLKLKDKAMVGNLWETNDGEFKQLRSLKIRDSDPVKWETDKDHFPSLLYLKLKFCSALEASPSEIGEIPTLEAIELIRCSLGIESSAKEMLGEDSEIELMIENDEKV